MDKKVISYLLKTVVAFIVTVFLFAGVYLVPSYMRFIQQYESSIGSIFQMVLIYINVSFVPVYLCLLMAWRVFTTIGRDNAFCRENVKRFQTASWLAIVDVLMVISFYLLLRLSFDYLVSPFFLLCTLGLILLGLSASIVCFALARLVSQAAELKQEVDLTV